MTQSDFAFAGELGGRRSRAGSTRHFYSSFFGVRQVLKRDGFSEQTSNRHLVTINIIGEDKFYFQALDPKGKGRKNHSFFVGWQTPCSEAMGRQNS